MARLLNGTSDFIATPDLPPGVSASGAPCTMSFWFYPSLPASGAVQIIGGIFKTSSSRTSCYAEIFNNSGVVELFCNTVDESVSNNAGPVTNLVIGTWNHVAIWWSDTSTPFVALNGVYSTAGAKGQPLAIGGLDAFALGVLDLSSKQAFFDGRMAEAACWNTVLDAAELSLLASGVPPALVRPANLRLYLPLDGLSAPEPDWSGTNTAGALAGTAYADHPPQVRYARRSLPVLAPPGGDVDVAPGAGALSVTGSAPGLAAGTTVLPATGAAAFDGYAPAVAAGAVLNAGMGALAVIGLAPAIACGSALFPLTASSIVTGYAPQVTGGLAPVSVAGVHVVQESLGAPGMSAELLAAPGAAQESIE